MASLLPAPEVLWGLISRGIGLVLLVSFSSLASQIMALAGTQGLTPVSAALDAARRDFPAPQRYFYFPTLLWLSSDDRVLLWLPRLGALCGLGILVGGPLTPYLFACAFVLYLSLDRAATLIYPWDCLLFEATFFGIFLPATAWLPDPSATAAPLPVIVWVYRLMVFRVMVGFGKHKFLGSTPQDGGFLKGFFVNQPIPTPIGLAVHRWPMALHKAALVIMFIVELPLQFTVFFPGVPSIVGGIGTIVLMVGIQLTGNFGFFNLAMIVLSLSWLDTATASVAEPLFAPGAPMVVNGIAVAHTALAALCFPFNSFCAHVWMLWSPFLRVRPSFLTWPVALMRALHPFRLVHAYGVFPPQSPPPIKLAPVTEVSWDGVHHQPLQHRFFPTTAASRPVFYAPHHDRVEQAMIYEGSGINESFVYRNIAGRFDPYGHGGVPVARRMLERLVEGTLPPHPFYDRNVEAGRGAPSHARVRVYSLSPATPEGRARGEAYQAATVGPHFAPLSRGTRDPRPDLPPPELWHAEDVYWLLRSRFARACGPGIDPHVTVMQDEPTLGAAVEGFWSDFIPGLPHELQISWSGLRSQVQALQKAHTSEALHVQERLAARYSTLLFLHMLPDFLRQGLTSAFREAKPDIVADSLYELRTLAQHIVLQGRSAFDAVWAQPERAREHRASLSQESGHLLLAIFRYEEYVYDAQKLRLLDAVLKHEGRPEPTEKARAAQVALQALGERLWGSLRFVAFLKTQFTGPEDQLDIPEAWPRFRFATDGEVVPLEAFPGDVPPAM